MRKSFSTILILIFLSSCSLYTKPETPKLSLPANFKSAIKVKRCNLPNDWRLQFKDGNLSSLEKLSLSNNYDYKIAIKNIQIAKTYVDEAISNYFPQINLNANASRNALSISNFTNNTINGNPNRVYSLLQLGASASYELDFWNKIGNGVKSAKANVEAAKANSNIIKLTLISNVANTYFQLSALNNNLVNLKAQLQATKNIAKLNKTQYQGGLANIEPVDNAQIQVESVNTNLNNIAKQIQIAQNTLAYLTGQYPEHFHPYSNSILSDKNLERFIPANLPSQMLMNRPDIQAAYYQIFAFGYLQKQALANFFPDFSLTGTYGFASNSLSNFINNGNLFWSYAANMIEPLFDYAKRTSQYRRAKFQYESSVLNYKSVVLNAFTEVNNALTSYRQDFLSLQASTKQLASANEKLNLAKAQYKSGMLDYLTYLTYQLSYLQTQYITTNQTLLVYQDIILIYKVLGLGLDLGDKK